MLFLPLLTLKLVTFWLAKIYNFLLSKSSTALQATEITAAQTVSMVMPSSTPKQILYLLSQPILTQEKSKFADSHLRATKFHRIWPTTAIVVHSWRTCFRWGQYLFQLMGLTSIGSSTEEECSAVVEPITGSTTGFRSWEWTQMQAVAGGLPKTHGERSGEKEATFDWTETSTEEISV